MYKEAGDQDYAPALSALALIYLVGDGVQKDKEKALELYAEATEQGHAPAKKILDILTSSSCREEFN